jgi:hypothetical protein
VETTIDLYPTLIITYFIYLVPSDNVTHSPGVRMANKNIQSMSNFIKILSFHEMEIEIQTQKKFNPNNIHHI